MAYFVVGLELACLYALTASGLVVTYTTSGVFNFGHGAMGMFMAFVYWQLAVGWHLPWPLALIIVLFVLAPVMGAIIERLVIRPLHGTSLGVNLVVTLGLLLFMLALANHFWSTATTRHLPRIFPGQFRIFGVAVTDYNVMVLVVSLAVAGLWLLFIRTRPGITMRAVVDDRDLTARAGASPERVAQLSWAIGTSLAALAAILIAPLVQLSAINLTLLVVTGYAAAIVGRMKSLPLAVAGALLIGMAVSFMTGYLPNSLLPDFAPATVGPIVLLFGALLLLPQDRLRTARLGTGKVRRVTDLRTSCALGAVFIALAIVLSDVFKGGTLIDLGEGLAFGIIMLSLVLLTGYGGQVSLCQMTFAGLGAFCVGKIAGGDSVVGLIAAVLLPAVVGAVLAVVVLRLRGLYLALATLAFAEAMDNLFFNKKLGVGGILAVGRVGLHSQRGFLIEMAVLLSLLAIGLLALRRGPFGRQLAAMNDSELACASIGMNVTLTKVAAFTLAAGIAGLGGAMYGGWQGQVSPNDFQMLFSLILLLLIALAGIGTVGGAFAAAIFYAFNPVIEKHLKIDPDLFIGLGAMFLGRNPGGFAGLLADATEQVRMFGLFKPAASTAPAEVDEEPELVNARA
jgi:branched-chain amino acid transport system permease protein